MYTSLYKLTNEEYGYMRKLYKKGIITKEEWIEYCCIWEEYLTTMNTKIFYDLKDIC